MCGSIQRANDDMHLELVYSYMDINFRGRNPKPFSMYVFLSILQNSSDNYVICIFFTKQIQILQHISIFTSKCDEKKSLPISSNLGSLGTAEEIGTGKSPKWVSLSRFIKIRFISNMISSRETKKFQTLINCTLKGYCALQIICVESFK